jgi:nitrogen fixation/metabolism regulation signal transduction histidine kinase
MGSETFFKKGRTAILMVLRLVIILVVMMGVPLATYLIEPDQLIFTYTVIALVLIILVIELGMFLNRTNRELSGFLENIRNREFSIRFNEQDVKGTRRELYRTFNEVLQVYRDIRIEKEVQFRFLEHIIELIEIGILVLDDGGKVVLMNTAAGEITGVSSPLTWEQMKRKKPDFTAVVDKLAGRGRTLFEWSVGGVPSRLAIRVNRTTMLDKPYTLLTFKDIRSEVEDAESGAWVRLMRTLGHEIRNSVAPVSSLADTILLILKHEEGSLKTPDEITAANLSDVVTSAETIRQRGLHLHEFIEDYQRFTRLPAPTPQEVSAIELLNETAMFFKSEFDKSGIRLTVDAPDDLRIRLDPAMIQQCLVNLVRNSMEALAGRSDPFIALRCHHTEAGITLSLQDNGAGIDPEDMDNVFVPFYSTKPGGSGIGLSLTRQVMRLHGGNVRLTSKKKEGTVVHLDFQG